MGVIESALRKLDGKLLSIDRNTITGQYEMKIGLPKSWVHKSTDKVKIESISQIENAELLNISNIDEDSNIDDLIDFINLIIDTNEKISKREEEFTKMMEDAKKDLEEKAKTFYDGLEDLKEESFKSFDEIEEKKPRPKIEPEYVGDKKSDKVKEEIASKLT